MAKLLLTTKTESQDTRERNTVIKVIAVLTLKLKKLYYLRKLEHLYMSENLKSCLYYFDYFSKLKNVICFTA